MKTLAKTLFATVLTTVVLFTSAFSAVAADKSHNPSVFSTTIDFNKVVMTGNAKVRIIQSEQQKVVILNEYDKELTTVEQKGDKLFINSKEGEPIDIIVYVKDLHRIDASNSVSVTTGGRFSLNVLQVFLKDDAKAYVNGDVGSLYTLIKGHSELKLKGSSRDHVSVKSKVAKLKTDHFASIKTTTGMVEGETVVFEDAPDTLQDTIIAKRAIR